MKYLAYLILIFAIGLNLYLYIAETRILDDPNDNAFQFSLIKRTDWVWNTYHCPLSLSCLPNLVDHVVPTWAEGYPLPFYYSHIPQIVMVSSYHLLVSPISNLIGGQFSLFTYYHWINYLLLCFFPLTVYVALRIVGFSPLISAISALFAAHVSTDGLYGIDPTSFLWRGYGLTSQLYGMVFFPLAIAYTYKTLIKNSNIACLRRQEYRNSKQISNPGKKVRLKTSIFEFASDFGFRASNLVLAILFLALTISGHLGLGIMAVLSLWPFSFFDFSVRAIRNRIIILAVIAAIGIGLLAYWIIPVLLYNNYHIISFWDPIWKFNSYGAYEVIRQFVAGEIFDFGRYPIMTLLVTIGWFAAALSPRLLPFAILFSFWFLMYFGHTSWGGLIDLIPGMKDFHQHRFIVSVQIAGLFLIPIGLETLQVWIKSGWHWLIRHPGLSRIGTFRHLLSAPMIHRGTQSLFLLVCVLLLYLTIPQTINYNSLNDRWIGEANTAFRYSEKDFNALVDELHHQPPGRIYAGRPGNWGKQQRMGSTELYMQLGLSDLDISQFLPETWSPLSENDQDFDERILTDYDLLNIRTIVTDANHDFPPEAKLVSQHGPFQRWDVPTTGWFDVVSSPMMVTTDKTNYINIVHYWHRSFPRTWNMYPLISVEKNPPVPFPLQKTIHMVDEVSYQEITNNQLPITNDRKNIFADFPFVFPEATVSGKMISESVDQQTYSGVVEVPNPCPSCMIMFKMSYHPDWQVTIDGQPAEKYAVFPFFLATPATPGKHIVSWTYKPNGLKVFLLIIEITGIMAAAAVLFWQKNKRRT